MAKEIMKIQDRVVSVTRRGFLGKASKVLAVGAAAVVPLQLVKAEPSKRAEMAKALHEVVSQFTDDNCPSHVQVCNEGQTLSLAMDVVRGSSVEEIEVQLLPLFGGVS